MEITLEKSEMITIGSCRRTIFSWCAACGERTRLLPPEEIAFATPRTIYQWVEYRKVYFTELPDGLLLVCLSCAERENLV